MINTRDSINYQDANALVQELIEYGVSPYRAYNDCCTRFNLSSDEQRALYNDYKYCWSTLPPIDINCS